MCMVQSMSGPQAVSIRLSGDSKKNGKTTLIAALGLYHLAMDAMVRYIVVR